ncbi:hypothetical protein SELMODRAFT_440320 [Selaginella moellendorffii]|uniref:AAA+ ATPase domain-containing protein n=1 Tax=Selaginella moellendorffii TaxID=88036 RepID=D8RAY9_SELML|nr:hypothetical protein SELMODRAFT_440320 [Selaginella moellendorffii]
MSWCARARAPGGRALLLSSRFRRFYASATAQPSETIDDLSPQPSARPPSDDLLSAEALTPAKVVALLDRHIVGQTGAKRAVAVALHSVVLKFLSRLHAGNRWRRHRIPSQYREEILPKNILMIGPTGCGKTEIARRLAKMADAPFIKVEATKFTEVGFHGRDVDQIIRDLVENAILLQREKVRTRISKEVEEAVENRILDALIGLTLAIEEDNVDTSSLETLRKAYKKGEIDNRKLVLDVPEGGRVRVPIEVTGGGLPINDLIFKIEKALKSPKVERREVTVAEARQMLSEMEVEKHLQSDQIIKDAIRVHASVFDLVSLDVNGFHLQATESDGIVFIDEIDKIVTTSEARFGADASAEGVQRDLLPIIEGSGAFHSCKPSDMLAELQGRLPIRVELKGLTRTDLYRILTEPEINMIKQQQLLMATESVELVFSDDAIKELANVAAEASVNTSLDNIGARRLHTVIEKVVEDISFNAPERAGQAYHIDKQKVRDAVGELLKKTDLSKFVL